MSQDHAEAVVIGGGVAGAADAFFLSRLGIAPTILEQGAQLGSLTTSKAAACFRAQWDRSEFAALVLESIEFYEQFGAITGLGDWDIGLRQHGWLFLCGTADGPRRCEAFVKGHRRLGVNDSEALEANELRDRFPWVGEDATAGTFRARDGWVSPYEVTTGLARASKASVRTDTTVREILVEHGRVVGVRTDTGTVSTKIVVIAAGPFSARVAATAGISLPTFPVRRQLASVRGVNELPLDAPMVADADNHSYWRVDGEGAMVGMPLPEDPGEPLYEVPADWDFAAIAMEGVGRLTPLWRTAAESLAKADVTVMAGQYTCTTDVLPILGAVPGLDGLFLHTGDNGWGIESAPAAGRLVADAVAGKLKSNPYGIDRALPTGERRLVSNWP